MYTDADKHLKDFNALNQYQQEDEDIWGEEPEAEVNEEIDEEEILLISDDFVISEEDYINKKSKEKSNAFVKLENDPRITKIGRIIRKYSIDELPQLINILKVDKITIGIDLNNSLFFMYLKNSSPIMRGIRMSEIMRSGTLPSLSHSIALMGSSK